MSLMSQKEAKLAGRNRGEYVAWDRIADLTDTRAKGLLTGDLVAHDVMQAPAWLSGEWAGESINELLGSPDNEREEERQSGVADAYEDAAERAYWREIRAAARKRLRGKK